MGCCRAAPALKAVVPLIKKFKPEPIFQSGTSEAVEAAWKKMEGGILLPNPPNSTMSDWRTAQ
jgi:hypothetical protein